MELSPIGRAALVAREGRRLLAYSDSKGIATIGIGHTSAAGPPKVEFGMTITAEECDEIFARDILRFALPIVQHVKVPLEDHQFDALVSLAYNIGTTAFLASTLLKRLNASDYHAAAEAFLMWNKPAEIIPRRQAEREQFITPYSVSLPKARSTDKRPIAAPAPAKAPIPVRMPEVPAAKPSMLQRIAALFRKA
jgi:lysozyme